jgi:hypothetical protein
VAGQDQILRIPIGELPEDLMKAARERVRSFSVSMIATDEGDDRNATPCSGTLVALRGHRYILTARHVADFVHRRTTLGVMARGRLARLPTEALADFGPTLGVDINLDVGASGPDICAVRLAPEWAGFLEARGCTFYSIDTRMNDPEVIHGDDGIYFVTGAPSALLDRPKWQIGTLSYSTDICRRWDADGWDYVLANLNIEESGGCLEISVGSVGAACGGFGMRLMPLGHNFDSVTPAKV